MANPSNKTDGRAYLESQTKAQLIDRILIQEPQLYDSEEKYKKLFNEHISLKKQYDVLNRRYNKLSNEDLTKRILEFKARNLLPTTIREKLLLEGQDIELKFIKDVYNSELNLDLDLYYKQCVEKYLETIRINTTLYKQSSIEEINRLMSYAYELLDKADLEDVKQRMSIMDSISGYLEKRDKLMKNIDESGNRTEQDEALNETTENFKETSKQMLKMSEVRIIGAC